MAKKFYIRSICRDVLEAMAEDFVAFSDREDALRLAEVGEYIHTVIAETHTVLVSAPTLGYLVDDGSS